MIAHVALREVAEHVRSVRFLALCSLAAVLFPLGAHLGADGYARRRASLEWLAEQGRDHARRADATPDPEDGVQWGWHGGEARGDPALLSLRPPSALAAMVVGGDHAAPAFVEHSPEGIVASGTTRHPGGAPLDAPFVVTVVLGLLAILLTFDAIAGEQESGVLRLVLAHPVPRIALLLGKLAGAFLTLAIPMTVGGAAALGVLVARGVPVAEGDGVVRVALLAVAATLYVSTLLAAGLLASVLAARAKTALVVLLVAWTGAVLVLPRAAHVVAAALRPPVGDEVARRERRDAILALERERAARLAQAWRRASGSDAIPAGEIDASVRARYAAARAPIEGELFRRRRLALAELDARHRGAAARQRTLARAIAIISPAAALEAAMSALAGTGASDRDAWERHVAARQQQLEREAFDHVFGVELFDARAGGLRVRWAPDLRDPRDHPPRYAELPESRWSPPGVTSAVREALPSMVLLFALTIGAVGAAAMAMVRYEVR